VQFLGLRTDFIRDRHPCLPQARRNVEDLQVVRNAVRKRTYQVQVQSGRLGQLQDHGRGRHQLQREPVRLGEGHDCTEAPQQDLAYEHEAADVPGLAEQPVGR